MGFLKQPEELVTSVRSGVAAFSSNSARYHGPFLCRHLGPLAVRLKEPNFAKPAASL